MNRLQRAATQTEKRRRFAHIISRFDVRVCTKYIWRAQLDGVNSRVCEKIEVVGDARFDLRSVRYSGTDGRGNSRATRKHRGRAIRVILFARAALVGPLFVSRARYRLVSLHRSRESIAEGREGNPLSTAV